MEATAKTVEAETSSSLFLIELIRLAAVSFNPGRTSQKRSVLAVHKTITYTKKNNFLKEKGIQVNSSPTNACSQGCGRDRLGTMLAAKRSAGMAPQVNLWDVCLCQVQIRLPTQALKLRGDITRRKKNRASVAPQKGLISSKNFLKKLY